MVTPVLKRLNGTDGLFRDPTGGNGLIAEILQLLKITPTRLSTFARDESQFWPLRESLAGTHGGNEWYFANGKMLPPRSFLMQEISGPRKRISVYIALDWMRSYERFFSRV
jgi:hypothetical protein